MSFSNPTSSVRSAASIGTTLGFPAHTAHSLSYPTSSIRTTLGDRTNAPLYQASPPASPKSSPLPRTAAVGDRENVPPYPAPTQPFTPAPRSNPTPASSSFSAPTPSPYLPRYAATLDAAAPAYLDDAVNAAAVPVAAVVFYHEVKQNPVCHHHHHWDPAGDFIFTTSRDSGVYYCIQSELLFGRSTTLVEHAMRSIGRGAVCEFPDTTAAEWDSFLSLLCANALVSRTAHFEPTLRECLDGLSLGHKLDIPVLRFWAQSHLSVDFFATPKLVRELSSTGSPRAIDAYMDAFSIAERYGLDPYTYTLVCYAALINGDWADDNFCVDFGSRHPEAFDHVTFGRHDLQVVYTLLLQELIRVPDAILHARRHPDSCKAALAAQFCATEAPADVLGTMCQFIEKLGRENGIGCCEGCHREVAHLVISYADFVQTSLPHYFGIEVGNGGTWVSLLSKDMCTQRI